MHGFADASIAAYGACLYLSAFNRDGSSATNLICSKSRVAPLKTISLPRLELCGCLLLARLCKKVVLTLQLKEDKVIIWTDSQVALAWISDSPSRWATLVANSVAEIQEITSSWKWAYVHTSENPADLISRGVQGSALVDCSLWWNGPTFLKDKDTGIWDKAHAREEITIAEERKNCTPIQICPREEELLLRFSSFSRLQRSLAFCLRFTNNCQRGKQRLKGQLTVEEIRNSLIAVWRVIQNQHFSREINSLQTDMPIDKLSKIVPLNPFFG